MDAPAYPDHLVLYDGACGLCSLAVQFILDHDAAGTFHLAPLQGETAEQVRARHPEIPAGLDSILVVTRAGGRESVAWESSAVFAICRGLPAPWRWFAALSWVPAALADPVYRFIARNRLSVFGTADACRLPSEAEAARLLP